MLSPLVLALALTSPALPSVAASAPGVRLREPAAEAEFRRALEAWDKEDYVTAAEALDVAYAIEPQPDLLYARAQVRRMLGRCRDALSLFQAYLDTQPVALDKIRDTHVNMERCRAELQHPPDDPTVDEAGATRAGEPSVTASLPPSPSSQPAPRPWHRDPLGGALVGVGTAGLAAGVILWRATGRTDDRSSRAGTYGEFRRFHDHAERLELAATLVTVGGSAALVSGVIRWVVIAARQRRSRSR